MTDFIILAIIAICVVTSVSYYLVNKKSGKSSCGCNCDQCSSTMCHGIKLEKESKEK